MADMSQFAEIPDPVRNIMKASIDQARKAFEAFYGASQNAMSNFEGAPNLPGGAFKQLNEKIAEFTRLNADANFRLAMKLADARQISDVVEIQSKHVHELMETYARQLEEIRELTGRVVKDAAQNATSVMPGV